jgi:hypothetical protein
MELTLQRSALSESRSEIAAFYRDVFVWEALDVQSIEHAKGSGARQALELRLAPPPREISRIQAHSP